MALTISLPPPLPGSRMLLPLLLLLLPMARPQAPVSPSSTLWPLPKLVTPPAGPPQSLLIQEGVFRIVAPADSGADLELAVARYMGPGWIFPAVPADKRSERHRRPEAAQPPPPAPKRSSDSALLRLDIAVADPTANLSLGVDESYNLTIAAPAARLSAATAYGAIRGLETFASLVACGGIVGGGAAVCSVPVLAVADEPRFVFRGILVDVARHYINVTRLHDILDAMAVHKLNVMLIHLTDDQSFPFQSQSHPNLTAAGAFDNASVYSHKTLLELAQHAHSAGVLLQVELDMPAHAGSWRGEPEILICKGNAGQGLVNPMNPHTFTVLSDVYGELADLVDSVRVHLGGDEVERSCWQNSPAVVAWAASMDLQVDAWDCPGRTVCSVECYFHVQQVPAAAAAMWLRLFWMYTC